MKEKKETNIAAIVALIISIIGIVWGFFFPYGIMAATFFGAVGLVMGILARRIEGGKRMSTAAIVISGISILLVFVTIMFFS